MERAKKKLLLGDCPWKKKTSTKSNQIESNQIKSNHFFFSEKNSSDSKNALKSKKVDQKLFKSELSQAL